MVSRVVPHDELLAEAEKTAHQILRNSQRAVRSAEETILDVIGRPLDDQLKLEAVNGYSTADHQEAMRLFGRFYAKTGQESQNRITGCCRLPRRRSGLPPLEQPLGAACGPGHVLSDGVPSGRRRRARP